jgi:very-short-patch-repair endonuclease
MAQPVSRKRTVKKPTVKKLSEAVKKKRPHPKYGTSKLEDYFAENFLDVIGVKYVRQYEAKEIGRFYDFYCEKANIIIEVDGDYYHSYGLKYEEKNPMQKHNQWVDRVKDEWALERGIPVIRVWEHDIHENPEKVMKILKEAIGKYTEKQNKIREKNRRH